MRTEQYDYLLYLDIETLPDSATVGMDLTGDPPGWTCPESGEPPANYKAEEAIERWREREREKAKAGAWKEYRDRALSPMTGRIACIGWALDNKKSQCWVADIASPFLLEKDILARLEDGLTRLDGPFRIVGHNVKGFDVPYLRLRAMAHGMDKLARMLSPGPRYSTKVVDTCDLWPASSSWNREKVNGSAKLSEVCKFLGITRENQVMGSQVFEAYVAGRLVEIADHCMHDVEDTRDVYKRLESAGFII